MRHYSKTNLINGIIIDDIFKAHKTPLTISDKQLLDSKLRDFLTNLNVLIIWNNKSKEDISVNAAIKRLEYMLGKNLSEKFAELTSFVVEYSKTMKNIDNQYEYPKTMNFIHSNYYLRQEAILDFKKEGISTLKKILEPLTKNYGCEILQNAF